MSGPTPNALTSHDNAGIAAWRFKLTHEISSYDSARAAHDELYHDTTPANATTDRVRTFRGPGGVLDHRYGYRIGPNMYVVDTSPYGGEPVGQPLDAMSVYLYDTEIIRYYAGGTFSVDCGGFATSTTRERLNAILPDGFHAYFHDHRLGLWGKGHEHPGRARTPFAKGSLWPLSHEIRIYADTGFWVHA
jgi:hypothetical protein